MERLTKTEISWIIFEINKISDSLKNSECQNDIERAIAGLRAEQFDSIADRLECAIMQGDKRIEISY